MKSKNLTLIMIIFILFSCNDMNLNPLSETSSENWYANEEGINTAILYLYSDRYLYSSLFRDNVTYWPDGWTDDWTNRNLVSEITGGTINSQTSYVTSLWSYAYAGIANANIILDRVEKLSGKIDEVKIQKYIALTKFVRACLYSRLIFFYGDVPYTEKELDIDEAFTLSRTNKSDILQSIYADFDYASSYLPVKYGSSELKLATKGAALGFKARIALHMSDWEVVRDAAKACMDLVEYQLLPDFSDVLTKKNSAETIFARPRSANLGVIINATKANQPITRTAAGTDYVQPSWELFCSFLCTDGLPIDESPLYNPREPFKNRDPRCAKTIVEFGTRHLGVIYQPHPDTLNVYNFITGATVKNNDSKANTQWASFNGLAWKKGIDEQYWLDKTIVDPDDILMRFADVLLMYAEAKIELGEIDQSVRDAMNKVRARAYGVDYTATTEYPVITATSQVELRKIVRVERRMELAFESLRYYDIIRWRMAEKVLNRPIYGLLDLKDLRTKIVNTGLWFFPDTPSIDEDGIADFSAMYNAGLIKLLINRVFDASKQYLWPIGATEVQINPNIQQNPGY